MDKEAFYGFLILAIIVGLTFGVSLSNSITASVISSSSEADELLSTTEVKSTESTTVWEVVTDFLGITATEEDTSNEVPIYCKDTDGGDVVSVFGVCKDSYGSYSDYCNNNWIVEYFCNSQNRCDFITQPCPFGCLNGACKTEFTDYCTATDDFYLESKNNVFHLEKCHKAIYIGTNRKYEVILHRAFYDEVRQKNVAHIQYKEYYLNSSIPCDEQEMFLAVEDMGFVVELFKIAPEPANRVLIVMPERFYEYSCGTTIYQKQIAVTQTPAY